MALFDAVGPNEIHATFPSISRTGVTQAQTPDRVRQGSCSTSQVMVRMRRRLHRRPKQPFQGYADLEVRPAGPQYNGVCHTRIPDAAERSVDGYRTRQGPQTSEGYDWPIQILSRLGLLVELGPQRSRHLPLLFEAAIEPVDSKRRLSSSTFGINDGFPEPRPSRLCVPSGDGTC